MTILARRGERRHARDRTILRVTRIFFCDFEVVFNMKRKNYKRRERKSEELSSIFDDIIIVVFVLRVAIVSATDFLPSLPARLLFLLLQKF